MLAVVLLALAALGALVFTGMIGRRMRALSPYVTTPAAPKGGVSLQLARGRDAAVAVLRSWDHEIAGRGERGIDVSLRLLDLDASFIWAYCGAFAFAGLATIVGLGRALPAGLLTLACGLWLAAVVVMGWADTIENANMEELLRAGPERVAAGQHDAVIARMTAAARVKFTLFFGGLIVLAALWVWCAVRVWP